ncbi:energy transducer TonB [Zavarzinia compransoris]|uniref:TonB family protein n=1 Tax=Zavarzinia marina TaxID=2911065 RepID=UPI001F3EBDE2|nr:TonB family protein [Zavarzinia marina]MCF4165071.1 energy transducer TonB [Zavarzinia marina]
MRAVAPLLPLLLVAACQGKPPVVKGDHQDPTKAVAASSLQPMAEEEKAFFEAGRVYFEAVEAEKILVSDEEAEKIFDEWTEAVIDRFDEATRYPPRSAIMRASGTVVYEIMVAQSGDITSCEMMHSSGTQSLDDYTGKAYCGTELPPIPEALGVQLMRITMPARYEFVW